MTVREYAKKLGELPKEVQNMDMNDIEIILVDDNGDLFLVLKTKK